jgi:hypothetical protein
MDKTQNLNDVQHRTGQEMYREVRATLTSVRKFELKREKREDLVREVNETAMGIRPSNSSRDEKLKLKSNLELISDTEMCCKQHSHNNRMIKPPSSCHCDSSTGSSMPEPSSVRGERQHMEMNETDHDTAMIKPTS